MANILRIFRVFDSSENLSREVSQEEEEGGPSLRRKVRKREWKKNRKEKRKQRNLEFRKGNTGRPPLLENMLQNPEEDFPQRRGFDLFLGEKNYNLYDYH